MQRYALEDAIEEINGAVIPFLVLPLTCCLGGVSRLVEHTKGGGRIDSGGITTDNNRATIRKVAIYQQINAIGGLERNSREGPEPRVVSEGCNEGVTPRGGSSVDKGVPPDDRHWH